jgi:glycosyltransferase involved in cell wall biosynthesis
LDGAVRSACEQTLDRSRYEVLVVDNNSTDRTATLIAELMERYPHLRYCREGVQGLSAARNRGMRESSAGYLGFLDDDAKAPEHWLERAMHIIEERAPGVFGGPYYPFYESPKPAWFLDEFGTRKMAERARPLRPNEDLSGGNLFIRRELLGSMGGFQPDMGMKGGTLAYGEETLLQWQIQRRFPHEVIYYEPDLFVYHLVRADKMSFRWRARQRFAQGRYNFRLRHQWMDEPVTTSQVLVLSKDVVRVSIKRLSLDLVRRDRARYPALRSYLFGKAFDSLYICGYLTEWAAKRLLHP